MFLCSVAIACFSSPVPAAVRIAREVGVDGRVRGGLHVVGRREVGLAGAELHDVHALLPQLVGLDQHLQRRRRRHTTHPFRQHASTSLLTAPGWDRPCSARNRASTAGGTKIADLAAETPDFLHQPRADVADAAAVGKEHACSTDGRR